MSDINWALANTERDPVAAGREGALSGYDLGQRGAVRSALQGLELGNPASVDSALSGLVHAGAFEQATALQNLNFSRMKLALGQQGLNAFSGLVRDQTPDQGAAQPAAQADSAQTQPQPQAQAQHAQETAQMAADALAQIKAAPPEFRHAAFAAARQQFINRGVPTEAIDSVGQHLGDANFSDESLDELTDHYQAHAANFGNAANGQPTTEIAPHPVSNWGLTLLNDPVRQQQILGLQMLGLNPESLFANARTVAGPALAGQTATAEIGPHVAEKGAEAAITANMTPIEVPEVGADGQPTGRTIKTTVAQFIRPRDQGGYGGQATGLSPKESAQQTAAGNAAGEAPARLTTVKINGADQQGTFEPGPHGSYIFHPVRVAGELGGGTAGGGAVGGADNLRPGQSLPPGEQQYREADASNFAHTVATQGTPENLNALHVKSALLLQAVRNAEAINPNAFSPAEKSVVDLLNSVGLDSSRANDLNYYSSLIPQVLKTTFTSFPRLEKEFELVQAATPSLKTPRDAAALTFATMAAVNAKNEAYARFVAGYQGPHSQDALNKAWQASPQARASIFADPAFDGLTIDGRPAVYVNPKPYRDGHVYGVFRPGTSFAQTFEVR